MKNFTQLIKYALISLMLLFVCETYSQVTINYYDFNSGFQGWTDGGTDAGRTTSTTWSCSNAAVYSKDNDTSQNYMTSPTQNLTGYSQIDFSFCYKSWRIDNGEGFDLQYYDGSSWSTLKSYVRGTDFPSTGSSYTYNFTFSMAACDYTLVSNAAFRMTGTANADSEYNFFDDVLIEGYSASPTEMDVQGNGVSIADGDTTPNVTDDTDFGTLNIGSNVSHTFTIYNYGTSSNLNLTGAPIVAVSGSTDFTVTAQPSVSTVAICNSVTYVVQFAPTSSGTHNASISIANNDSDENPYNFDIIGYANAGPPDYTAYYENFDSSNGGWTVVTSTNGNWVWTNTFTTADEMGEGSFWRNLNYNSYSSNANIVIQSPVYNFSGLQNLKFSIDIKYNTEDNNDGMRILYSINGGAFTVLGASGQGTNWYNDNVAALGSDGWNNDGHPATPAFSPHSQFGQSYIDLSDVIFSNQSNVRFRVEFRSNGSGTREGVAFDNVLIEANPLVALNDANIAPANITNNLRLWLKANSGIAVADGSLLTNWEDQAFDTSLDKEDAYSASTLAPTYRDNGTRNMNYNPIADFDHTTTEYMNGKGGFYAKDYFVVMRSDDIVDTQTGGFSPGREFGLGGRYSDEAFHEDPSGLGMGSTSARYSNEILSHNVSSFPNGGQPPNATSWGRAYTTTTNSYQNHPIIINVKSNAAATSTEIYKNGKRVDNTTGQAGNGDDLNFNEFENLQYLIGMGRSGINGRTTSQMNGMITEVISYTSPNSALNQQKIQSYLGVKYGVTMQDVSSVASTHRLNDVDYIDSNGNVFWDTSANTVHNYDVAGIGRDDKSLLLQKQSRSQNDEADGTGPTSGFLTMALTQTYNTNNENITGNSDTFNDGEFLMWGNNNADLNGAPINIFVDMSSDMGDPGLLTQVSFTGIPRIWKVVETGGDITSVEVSIPTSIVRTATPPDGTYLMFISQNGVFDPTAGYRVMSEIGGYLYADYEFDGTEYITFGWAPEETFERSIFFYPPNADYLDVEDWMDLDPTGFTLSAWVNRNTDSFNKSIMSKRDAAYTEGYDFKITSTGYFEVSWYNAGGSLQTLTSSVTIPQDEWHQLAVIYDGSVGTLYIDGVSDTSASRSAPVPPTAESFIVGAAGKLSTTAFFHGNIDEVRIWESALTDDQLHYIMNQELEENTNFVGGKYFLDRSLTPTKDDISTVPWADLAGYYPMSTYTYTNAKDASGNGHQGALRNLVTVDWQTAPLPYKSTQNGDWDNNNTWLDGSVQTIPGTTSIVDAARSIDWNIVQTTHDVTLVDDSDIPVANGGNRSVLALLVDSNDITVNGDTASGTGYGLTITHYLNLDGDMDLQGESQLIQTLGSDLEVTSSGKLERDQQGTADLYTYNYWSSPVGVSNLISNNNSYSVPDVVRDGIQNINFITTGYDGTDTNPIGIADYWIWKFNNLPDDDYDSWFHVRSTGTLLAGEGYTMKGPGSGVVLDDQNYVYIGKPNNSDINLPLTAGHDYLVGNPYASAIDSHQFILDNAPVIEGSGATTGTVYFWEHWGGGSHVLSEYLGGYATYNLSGGVPSAAQGTNDPDVGTGGTPTKTPGRYIPVGQGFFVVGETTGTINFNNGQRAFQRESASSVFMEANPLGNETFVIGRSANAEPDSSGDPRTKLRLGFNSVNTLRRQLLLTIDEKATEGIDWGYDGHLFDDQIDDMYWMIDEEKMIIQGSNSLDIQTVLPLGIHTNIDGMNSIALDAVENDPGNLDIYVHDKELNIYHDLRVSNYEFFMKAGETFDRFEITFDPEALGNGDNGFFNIDFYYSNESESIILLNPTLKSIESIEVFNLLGQSIYSVEAITNSEYAEYKVSNFSTGTYILKINTQGGSFSKKVLVDKI